MKKRELFVFAGQSNMMGACVYPPRVIPHILDSYEYLYRNVQMGAEHGEFRTAGFPCGEFLYRDLFAAYPEGLGDARPSDLADYQRNTYYVPSMCSLKDERTHSAYPFSVFSENNYNPGPALPPYLAEEWEKRGNSCAYAHIAKGSVSILHYFDDEMYEQYLESIKCKCEKLDIPIPPKRELDDMSRGASACFEKKTRAFFRDSERLFRDEDTSTRCLLWLQGENDTQMETIEYETLLEQLWVKARNIGFTHFFCIRVGFFGREDIVKIMKAQELFCRETQGAYMITRAYSLMPFAGQDEGWFTREPEEKYQLCRDSFYGYMNQHINEKGFILIAKKCAENMKRILHDGTTEILEDELVRKML